MTVAKETKSWLSIAGLALVVTIGSNLVLIAFWGGGITTRIETIERHAVDTGLHMPFEVKLKTFVTRTEFEARRIDINERLNRIEDKQDKIIELLQGK